MKTISNITAVAGGSAASVLFIILFSQTGSTSLENTAALPLMMLLLSGILLLTCGVVGLLSSNKILFLVFAVLSLAASLAGLIISEDRLIFAVLIPILLFVMVCNLLPAKKTGLPESEEVSEH